MHAECFGRAERAEDKRALSHRDLPGRGGKTLAAMERPRSIVAGRGDKKQTARYEIDTGQPSRHTPATGAGAPRGQSVEGTGKPYHVNAVRGLRVQIPPSGLSLSKMGRI
jgi:hypothetical protein